MKDLVAFKVGSGTTWRSSPTKIPIEHDPSSQSAAAAVLRYWQKLKVIPMSTGSRAYKLRFRFTNLFENPITQK